MGFIASWIGALIAPAVIVAILKRIAVALGIAAFSVVGVNVLISQMQALIASQIGMVAVDIMAILDIYGFRSAISVIVSGYITALSVKGLTSSGKLTRLYWDKSSSVVLN